MKYIDYACAWTIFLRAIVFIVIIEFGILRGSS
jgi:hypothetical protein